MAAHDYAQTIQPFTFPQIGGTAPSYENIIRMLSQQTATESQFMPELQNILSQRGQMVAPQIAGMEAAGQRQQADLMGMMARRGLTGGSIEAQALGQQGAQIQGNIAQMLSGIALQNSQMFAQLLSRARSGDVAAQRAMMQMIAQAMGEEMTAQRDIQMFQQGLGEMRAAEGRRHLAGQQAALWEAGLGIGQAYGKSSGWLA
ncbi:MAG: hypothetical protein QME60_01275 [Verrucomicrobiota bacterium]|nr:hypothetical protein [Verrucomicrobiota bacterium]